MSQKTITVRSGQSVVDVALQYYGTVNGVWDISRLNNISITEQLAPGQQLIITETINETTKYLGSYKDKITHVIANGNENAYTGIDYWTIGVDFIVQ